MICINKFLNILVSICTQIKLHGADGGGGARWSGHVTYGRTALLRAAPRAPTRLALYNRAGAAVFVCARLQLNRMIACFLFIYK